MRLARPCTALAALLALAEAAPAQVVDPVPPQRQIQPYIQPEYVVSFAPDTPFNEFIRYVSPLAQQVTGRAIVDPTGRTTPIGFYVTGMYFLDALDLVLQQAGLTYRQTDRYLVVEPLASGAAMTGAADAQRPSGPGDEESATSADREIRIDALMFEVNLDRLSEIGINWGSILSQEQGGGTGGGGGDDSAQDRLRLFLRTETFFDAISAVIEGPDRIDLSELNQLFRLFESRGIGRTISSPSIVVRSGQEGRIQSGSDIPVTLRDFAGNTVTQFIPTGVIITARPTLYSDDLDGGGAPIQFVHLVTDVERSAGRLTTGGVAIDKNEATTEVLLLDGEQTVIGGLYTTEYATSRGGIPVLKDLPLLGYLFGVKRTSLIQRELIIVLQARLVDPLRLRSARPAPRDLLERERELQRQRLLRFQQGMEQEGPPPGGN